MYFRFKLYFENVSVSRVPMKKNLAFCLSFVLLTIVGTLLHEGGHIVVAKCLGYDTILHYGSMDYGYIEKNESNLLNPAKTDQLVKIDIPYGDTSNAAKKLILDDLWITLGGPIQTIGTGILGMFLLLWRKRPRSNLDFQLLDWLGVFFTLFWSRQIFNLVIAYATYLIRGNGSRYGGDERHISSILHLPDGTLSLITGSLAFIICSYTVFRIVPAADRLRFISFGLVGSVIGYALWFKWLGPIVLP
jgi:hypothetical protein